MIVQSCKNSSFRRLSDPEGLECSHDRCATKQDQSRIHRDREELVEHVQRAIRTDGRLEIIPNFFLTRSSKPTESVESVYDSSFCIVVQGSKKVLLGNEVLSYDPGHSLIFTVDLPVVFQVEEASEDRPYLGCRLTLDPSLVAWVMAESGVERRSESH